VVEWHCLGSGPHLCGSITKAGPRNAALSFQGGFGLVVHRWHRVLDSQSRGDISLCGETQELALHRFNAGAVCFDVVFGRPMDVFRRVVRIDFLRLRTPARDDPKSASCRRPPDEKERGGNPARKLS